MKESVQRQLLVDFKVEVHDRGEVFDPDNELDWYSVTVGWALAKGVAPEEARDFAAHVRYQTDLG